MMAASVIHCCLICFLRKLSGHLAISDIDIPVAILCHMTSSYKKFRVATCPQAECIGVLWYFQIQRLIWMGASVITNKPILE